MDPHSGLLRPQHSRREMLKSSALALLPLVIPSATDALHEQQPMTANGGTDPSQAFMTCTSCHNQHVMYVYAPPAGKQNGTAIAAGSAYPTYFFVNGPYNPGAGNTSPTLAASTTQFCRQCHFGESNEAAGINSVKTQF